MIYVFLLFLLVQVEKNAEGATIHSMSEAMWYSLVTFTTVGYGDLAPVTHVGRIIASVFLLIGIGLLGFFIGFMTEFFAKMRLVFILAMNTDKPWYVFTDKSAHAMIFAENLKAIRPNALILCMKENEMENFLDAVDLADISVSTICLANFTPAHHPVNINFFSLTDCTFYDMTADGFSLDDKRTEIKDNDIPDIISRFKNLEAEKDRKRTEKSFMVTKKEIADNDYDLSINKYKEVEYVAVEYPPTSEIMANIREIEKHISQEMDELEKMLAQ